LRQIVAVVQHHASFLSSKFYSGGLLMKKTFFLLLIALICMGTLSLSAQENQKPMISVSADGKASAKADIAIVLMSVRSTSPLAADALEQNNKKVEDVKGRLTALGYKDAQVKFTGNRFAPSGAGIFYPGGQRPTGFDVYNNFLFLPLIAFNYQQQVGEPPDFPKVGILHSFGADSLQPTANGKHLASSAQSRAPNPAPNT